MKLTIAELQQTIEFQSLNPRHKAFVLEYVKDSDAARAAAVVYTSHKNPAIAGAELVRQYRIQKCLDKFFGRPALDRALEDLHLLIRQHLRNGKKGKPKTLSNNLVTALRYYALLGGQHLSPITKTPLEPKS